MALILSLKKNAKFFIYTLLFDPYVSQVSRVNEERKGFLDKAWGLQHKIEERQQRIGKGKYGRVLKMARKPTGEEYEKTAKITGLGILLIGALGFVVYIIRELVAPWILKALGY
jgi:protein transport protein SEC61 subunit gamma-like protein